MSDTNTAWVDELPAYRSVDPCPKCLTPRDRAFVKFCTNASEIRSTTTTYVDVTRIDDPRTEHLHLECSCCGFIWRERCADDEGAA